MYAEPTAKIADVGALQGTLRRIEGKLDALHDLVTRVEQAANMVEMQPAEFGQRAKSIGEAPRPQLTLSRLENDLDNEMIRLTQALNILS